MTTIKKIDSDFNDLIKAKDAISTLYKSGLISKATAKKKIKELQCKLNDEIEYYCSIDDRPDVADALNIAYRESNIKFN